MNRSGIRAVVEAVERIPIVANGDILTIADAAATFEETGCAAVSIGRGALANPFIFRQLDCWARTGEPGPEPAFDERLELMRRHFHGLVARAASTTAACSSARSSSGTSISPVCPSRSTVACSTSRAPAVFDEVIEAVQAAGPGIAAAGALRVPRAGPVRGDR